MSNIRRIFIIVLDSCGVGALPDAMQYGDQDSNTLANVAKAVGGLDLPSLQELGLGNIIPIKGIPAARHPLANYGKMATKSVGKDSISGHWEMMGVILERPLPLYPNGFPREVIVQFESRIGRGVLGNRAASGTEIIEELGALHLETGFPIVYTSGDSVFQIAAHESIVPIEELYEMCQIARAILKDEHSVGRVIARPFVGQPDSFQRTAGRKDFSLKPWEWTLLDRAQSAGIDVVGVGKIGNLFANQGITKSIHTTGNDAGVDQIADLIHTFETGIVLANLGDFDTLYGHRNNPVGFAQALVAFDSRLPQLLAHLREDDVLTITADHGCDPTTASTDHSREYVPVLVFGNQLKKGLNLSIRSTLADLGATVADFLALTRLRHGVSFMSAIL